jgi:GNAT superfamily N-acetyltransferase
VANRGQNDPAAGADAGEAIAGLVATDAPPPGTHEAMFEALDAASRARVGPAAPRLLVIPLRDPAGQVVGGVWAYTVFGWLTVQMLAVPPQWRGRGVGTALLAAAEAEARARGCRGAHLDAFSFQAAPFYIRRGYREFGRLADFPPGHDRLYFWKPLPPAGPAAPGEAIAETLARARRHAARGDDPRARDAYLDVLRRDATHFAALNELATLAFGTRHIAAARAAYEQAVRHHPDNPIGRVNLGNLLLELGEAGPARDHYAAALDAAPNCAPAHQGLARALTELGEAGAERHWRLGFAGHGAVTRPYRGTGRGVAVLLLVATRGGNIPTRDWLDDRVFAVTTVYADAWNPADALPPRDVVVNAIGDADARDHALRQADILLAGNTAPVVNQPARVRATGRVANAARLAAVPGVVTAATAERGRAELLAAGPAAFPLLLRVPGEHGGRHFQRVETASGLAEALATLPGERLLAIQPLEARGADGHTRKYRVVAVEGALYPAHLAIASQWKVHYFSADMATRPDHRAEEARFLDDMPGVLGARAMAALAGIVATLGLDYMGIDFALAPDGSVLLFEANATMVVVRPDGDPIWDYRRRAAGDVARAVRAMLTRTMPSQAMPSQAMPSQAMLSRGAITPPPSPPPP